MIFFIYKGQTRIGYGELPANAHDILTTGFAKAAVSGRLRTVEETVPVVCSAGYTLTLAAKEACRALDIRWSTWDMASLPPVEPSLGVPTGARDGQYPTSERLQRRREHEVDRGGWLSSRSTRRPSVSTAPIEETPC